MNTEKSSLRVEINELTEQHDRISSLAEQVKEYYSLSEKGELSEVEKVKLSMYKQAMNNNNILTRADFDRLTEQSRNINSKIKALKEKLKKCRQQHEVFKDTLETYDRLSKHDYVAEMVDEERKRQEQLRKKKPKR
ncbi:hypothetical protein [uncultured Ruminococcus sp.]|uniref:hypothetical protein n=1 Tax=uncultured Ruminococcus sp. TaxID=165186 RepID=UPI0025E0CCAB|nr:hypothetical protein [uncultured Ruminococcus sp.]